jgi:phage terminase large subunit-like protein
VYAAACDRDQAGRIFENIEAFIQADPDLADRCNIKRFEKSVEVLSGEGVGSYYKTLSSDASKGHALNPTFVVLDELAQWESRELYDNIMTGFGGRDEPLAFVISTKSKDPHSVMAEVTTRARDVINGVIEAPSFCGIIYDVPDGSRGHLG